MTREEAIKVIRKMLAYTDLSVRANLTADMVDACHLAIKALEQEPKLDKIRADIAEYGSIWVEYKITGKRDKDIEQLVSDVLSQAKKQVLEIIDKYKAESEDRK